MVSAKRTLTLLVLLYMAVPIYAVAQSKGRVVRYDLYIGDTVVNYTGHPHHAIAANGSIPMPTLTFTEGDTAEIYVHNRLKENTSIHWHGVMVPNQYDGVSYLTTMPIEPGMTHLFKFPIIQNGTYWYHSHEGLQEQSGMYGMLIFKKREKDSMKEYPIILSDWADMGANEINRSLHTGSDWFNIKKGTVQSYGEALAAGYAGTKFKNEWKRMTSMDVSDVAYDRMLINGKADDEQKQYKAGDKVKLRIVNGSSSTYFWLNYAGGKITVVANDGMDVQPVEVDRLIVAVAETYDVIVTIPKNKSYQFLATAEDRGLSTSLWLGIGEKIPAQPLKKLNYFAGMKLMNGMMRMNGDMKPMSGMAMSGQAMDMNSVMYPEVTVEAKETGKMDMGGMKMDDKSMDGMNMSADSTGAPKTLNYTMLRSTQKTNLPQQPTKDLYFELTGNMNRYVWSINNKTVSESDRILIHKGENVRIVLYNNTMMRHPMHLHGHFFRLLNGQGDYSPLKHTLDIMPMETDTIEFDANQSGDWFFHCHILYHMMSGMGRIFSYENSPPNPDVPDPMMGFNMAKAMDAMPYFMANVGLQSNGSDGSLSVINTRWKYNASWNLGFNEKQGYASDVTAGRYLDDKQFLLGYVGYTFEHRIYDPEDKNIFGNERKTMFGQSSDNFQRSTVTAGIAYTLPLLFVADARVDGNGKFRLQLGREDIPLTPRLRFNLMLNSDKEYNAGLRYIVTKYISLSGGYDSDRGLGGGLDITY